MTGIRITGRLPAPPRRNAPLTLREAEPWHFSIRARDDELRRIAEREDWFRGWRNQFRASK